MSENRLYAAMDDLKKFIGYMARIESVVGGHWFLNQDDLESEAYLLLMDLVKRYESKSYEDFLKLCKRSIVNQFKSLKGKYLKSNRKNDHYAIAFEDTYSTHKGIKVPYSELIGVSGNTSFTVTNAMSDHLYASSQTPATNEVSGLYEHLTNFDRAILDCLLGKNSRVPTYLHLVMLRSEFTDSRKPIGLNEYIISRALCCRETDVRNGFDRIKVTMERIT